MVALHAAWLIGLWWLGRDRPLEPVFVAVLVVLAALRIWVMAALGRRWTTRVIVVPGETLVRRGPYRFVSHPNYIIVVGEMAAVPLALGMPVYALLFSILNAAMLWVRISVEDAALRQAAGSGRR
jgi:methyltransferase